MRGGGAGDADGSTGVLPAASDSVRRNVAVLVP